MSIFAVTGGTVAILLLVLVAVAPLLEDVVGRGGRPRTPRLPADALPTLPRPRSAPRSSGAERAASGPAQGPGTGTMTLRAPAIPLPRTAVVVPAQRRMTHLS